MGCVWIIFFKLSIVGEDEDSTIRINAEESLNRVVKHCESTNNIIRVLIDCYHEIKKNGNERYMLIIKYYQIILKILTMISIELCLKVKNMINVD